MAATRALRISAVRPSRRRCTGALTVSRDRGEVTLPAGEPALAPRVQRAGLSRPPRADPVERYLGLMSRQDSEGPRRLLTPEARARVVPEVSAEPLRRLIREEPRRLCLGSPVPGRADVPSGRHPHQGRPGEHARVARGSRAPARPRPHGVRGDDAIRTQAAARHRQGDCRVVMAGSSRRTCSGDRRWVRGAARRLVSP